MQSNPNFYGQFDQEVQNQSHRKTSSSSESSIDGEKEEAQQINPQDFEKIKKQIEKEKKKTENNRNSLGNKNQSFDLMQLQSKIQATDKKLEASILPIITQSKKISLLLENSQTKTEEVDPQLKQKFLNHVRSLNRQMSKVIESGVRENEKPLKQNPFAFLDKGPEINRRLSIEPKSQNGELALSLRKKYKRKSLSKTQNVAQTPDQDNPQKPEEKESRRKQIINLGQLKLKKPVDPLAKAEDTSEIAKKFKNRVSFIGIPIDEIHEKIEHETRMKFRQNKKAFMIYPEAPWIDNWNLFISLILLFTAIVTPMRIAFVEKDDLDWKIINGMVDLMFFVDIIIIFNTAYYDEDFKTVDDRRAIANGYLKSWFLIDVLSIVPFDLLYDSQAGGLNTMARFFRIGKMYKLLKLTRLLKIVKILKGRGKFIKYVNDVIKIGMGFERLFFFLIMFLVIGHIVSCMWVLTANISESGDQSWLADVPSLAHSDSNHHRQATSIAGIKYDPYQLYLTSFYFTVETITTVGYGDYGPKTSAEKIFCIGTMLIGVMGFSFMSGALSSILQSSDAQSAALQMKMNLLNRIQSDYYLPLELYTNLKQTLKFNAKQDIEELNKFVDELPHNLKIEVSLFLHETTYKKIPFLKERSNSFKAWICPLLKPFLATIGQNIYYEDDDVINIFFLKRGKCGFVLPKHDNQMYIQMFEGSVFGVIDIIGSILQNESGFDMLNEWNKHRGLIKRQYTIMATLECELLSFSLVDLNRMKTEFIECYEDLFADGYQRLYRTLQVKLHAMKHCQRILDDAVKNKLGNQLKAMMSKSFKKNKPEEKVTYNLKVMNIDEIDNDAIFQANFGEDECYSSGVASISESWSSQSDETCEKSEIQTKLDSILKQKSKSPSKIHIGNLKSESKEDGCSHESCNSSCESNNYAMKMYKNKEKSIYKNEKELHRRSIIMMRNAKKKKIKKSSTFEKPKKDVNIQKHLSGTLSPPKDKRYSTLSQSIFDSLNIPPNKKSEIKTTTNIERLLLNLTSEILEIKNNQQTNQIEQVQNNQRLDEINNSILLMREQMRITQQTD